MKRKRIEELGSSDVARLGGTFCFASGPQSRFAVADINRNRSRECLEGLMNVPPRPARNDYVSYLARVTLTD